MLIQVKKTTKELHCQSQLNWIVHTFSKRSIRCNTIKQEACNNILAFRFWFFRFHLAPNELLPSFLLFRNPFRSLSALYSNIKTLFCISINLINTSWDNKLCVTAHLIWSYALIIWVRKHHNCCRCTEDSIWIVCLESFPFWMKLQRRYNILRKVIFSKSSRIQEYYKKYDGLMHS